MLRRQTLADVVTVPTSDKPEMKEWTSHYWYVLRCGALQASVSLSDAQVEDLVAWVKGFGVTTPCPDCRAHFLADWALYPFEGSHARDPMQAMFWVEELRRRIEQRKASAAASASRAGVASAVSTVPSEGAAGAGTSEAVPPTPLMTTAKPSPFGGRGVLTLGGRNQAVVAPMLPRSGSGNENGSMRKLAIQSAMQQTIANRVAEKAGVSRGCGCGKKKPQPKVA